MKNFMLFSALLVASAAFVQAATGNPGRVAPTMTRTIHTFSALENDWLDAVQTRDRSTLQKIIAPDFELRSAARPGMPSPREESLKSALDLAPFQSSIEQMAAHEYGEIVIVSFLWKLEVPANGPLPRNMFVIDTWKLHGDQWQVVARYTAPVLDNAKTIPGVMTGALAAKKAIK